jgi:hypothetical protein
MEVWAFWLPGSLLTTAVAIDRLVHNSVFPELTTDSYRMATAQRKERGAQ